MLRAHRLTDPLLFAAVVVAWGLTWYAIRLQLGPTPPETSIFWRFFLASIAMWAGLAATGRLKRAPWRGQPWLIAFGIVLFSVNFLCFYNAERFAPSGVVAVVFAVAPAFNVINLWLMRGVRPNANAIVGAALGALGVACLFADQLAAASAASGALAGVGLAVAGAYCFSLGNFVARPATRAAGDLPNAVARAMTWGTAILAATVAARGLTFTPTLTPAYVGGLRLSRGDRLGVRLPRLSRAGGAHRPGARRLYDRAVASHRARRLVGARRLCLEPLGADRRAADPARPSRHVRPAAQPAREEGASRGLKRRRAHCGWVYAPSS